MEALVSVLDLILALASTLGVEIIGQWAMEEVLEVFMTRFLIRSMILTGVMVASEEVGASETVMHGDITEVTEMVFMMACTIIIIT